MIDLFGLGKQKDQQDEPSSAPQPAEPAPRGSHKLWAFLLVLDSVFVIIFAGAVAAKLYQYWKAPTVAAVPAPRKRPAKPAEAPAASTAASSAPEPAKAPEPPKSEPPKAEPAAAAKPAAEAPRPPKPSILAEAPKHRETPKPADAGGKSPSARPAAPAPAAAPEQKVKAVRTEFKISAPKARSVELVGAFIVRGGRKEMSRDGEGTWSVTLYLNPGTYRYFFSVDKKKQLDPENPLSDKGASLLTIP